MRSLKNNKKNIRSNKKNRIIRNNKKNTKSYKKNKIIKKSQKAGMKRFFKGRRKRREVSPAETGAENQSPKNKWYWSSSRMLLENFPTLLKENLSEMYESDSKDQPFIQIKNNKDAIKLLAKSSSEGIELNKESISMLKEKIEKLEGQNTGSESRSRSRSNSNIISRGSKD